MDVRKSICLYTPETELYHLFFCSSHDPTTDAILHYFYFYFFFNLRLVDYMTVSSLWTLAIECHSEFVQTLLAPGQSSKNSVKIGIIHTKVHFDDDKESEEISFSCNDDDTLLAVQKITNGKLI